MLRVLVALPVLPRLPTNLPRTTNRSLRLRFNSFFPAPLNLTLS